ncbi:hypothetical protein [Paraburkholderia sp. GAS32]|uniref:hypothetical protein n=1 Tax=Paraburkholderia sp. GAS32 TaxID=3035129 RepID=UPI003D1AEF3A
MMTLLRMVDEMPEIEKTVRAISDAGGMTRIAALREAIEALQFYDDLRTGKAGRSQIGPYAIETPGENTVNVTPMEWALQNALRAERSKVARLGAQALHANSEHAKIKHLVIAEYEKNAAAMKADGRPVYRSKADFVRAMLDKYREIVDPNTISGWIKQSAVVVPHWRTRAEKKKISGSAKQT